MADLRMGVWDAYPPGGPNSFNFMRFLGKFGKIVCWCPPGELVPHLREILDPPLDPRMPLLPVACLASHTPL